MDVMTYGVFFKLFHLCNFTEFSGCKWLYNRLKLNR